MNKFIHEGIIQSGSQMVGFIRNYIKEIDGLSKCLPVCHFHTGRWVASKEPFLKIKFDAAFNKNKNMSCLGLVVRNAKAEVFCSKIIIHENIPSSFATEAMARLQALHFRLQLSLRKIGIEGDSRSVIRKLREEKEDRSDIEVFIKDSKHLSLGFESYVFRFITLESNTVAHLLATEGLKREKSTYLSKMVIAGAVEAMVTDQIWTDSMRDGIDALA
ncbi:hypothetical protein J1N35_002196 [Gossypium stocksii]|uniref:RNase H type-1 domain-containing protein n=1 Tax=Gossypium stocksii TaxID=47602 RepID=A0A9D4AN47_9ROSI|nr:hypothetical protein J1N35_002196 [Gossypium stocksii]